MAAAAAAAACATAPVAFSGDFCFAETALEDAVHEDAVHEGFGRSDGLAFVLDHLPYQSVAYVGSRMHHQNGGNDDPVGGSPLLCVAQACLMGLVSSHVPYTCAEVAAFENTSASLDCAIESVSVPLFQ